MALNLVQIQLSGITREAKFSSLSINQDREGNLSMGITYDIVTSDGNGRELTSSRDTIYLDQSEIMAQPGFASVYGSLRTVTRSSLRSKYPDLVSA